MIPKAGSTITYTSGWPKNQNRGWERPGESVGRMAMRSHAKSRIDQTKSGMRVHVIPRARMLWIVTIKLIAPASDEAERMWRERIHRSWPLPGAWVESGGYDVQPACAAPPFAQKLSIITAPPRKKSQYESAFSLGNATSRAPIMSGTR